MIRPSHWRFVLKTALWIFGFSMAMASLHASELLTYIGVPPMEWLRNSMVVTGIAITGVACSMRPHPIGNAIRSLIRKMRLTKTNEQTNDNQT